MKISQSLRDIYADAEGKYALLKQHVDGMLKNLKDPGWHYESRIKPIESFALKVETGRHSDPAALEDFFACWIVVENLAALGKAESLIRREFAFRDRRPPSDNRTTKPSDSFRFDDIRLYVALKDSTMVPATGLEGTVFEVQVKTFFAHAWAIATHDLTYKTDEKSWPKERIAFQVKAMIEHAEISIHEAERLAKSSALDKTDEECARIASVITLIDSMWPAEVLPRDRKRLAENIYRLIHSVGIDSGGLREVLAKETALGRGTQTLNLSPYATIVQSLLNQQPSRMRGLLTRRNQSLKVFIPPEVRLPFAMRPSELVNAIFVGKSQQS